MPPPWKGAATLARESDFSEYARRLRCDVSVLRAVWQVEAAGRAFRADGTLERRFEPHHFYASGWNWRRSLRLKRAERERLFLEAIVDEPEQAARATSWGGPQIMGFNHTAAGYDTALAMVRAMADSEVAQIEAFTTFVQARGLDRHMRSRDWRAFARGYNGPANVDDYAPKMERAYREITGVASPQVLSIGDRGPAVRKLQDALEIAADGVFGPQTDEALRSFQRAHGLTVDGIAGAQTWAAIRAERRDVEPESQPDPLEAVTAKIEHVTGVVGAFGGVSAISATASALRDALPPLAWTVATTGVVALVLAAGAAVIGTRLFRVVRSARTEVGG